MAFYKQFSLLAANIAFQKLWEGHPHCTLFYLISFKCKMLDEWQYKKTHRFSLDLNVFNWIKLAICNKIDKHACKEIPNFWGPDSHFNLKMVLKMHHCIKIPPKFVDIYVHDLDITKISFRSKNRWNVVGRRIRC